VSIIGNLPRGLLAALGSQNFGESPRQLSDVVSPVVDSLNLYLLNQLVQVNGLNLAPTNGYNELITIPLGEVWRVQCVSLSVVTGAGESGSFAPAARANDSTVALANTEAVAASLSRNITSGPMDVWFPSGYSFGALCGEVTLAPSLGLNMIVTRIRA
jgi:hypothetical protein